MRERAWSGRGKREGRDVVERVDELSELREAVVDCGAARVLGSEVLLEHRHDSCPRKRGVNEEVWAMMGWWPRENKRRTLSEGDNRRIVVEGARVLVRRPLQQEDGVRVVSRHVWCAGHLEGDLCDEKR